MIDAREIEKVFAYEDTDKALRLAVLAVRLVEAVERAVACELAGLRLGRDVSRDLAVSARAIMQHIGVGQEDHP